MESGRRAQALAATGRSGDGGVAAPMASTSVISTYNPAQIRAAYGLPALPAAGAKLSAAQAAQLGAGQTTYIVDAMHDPNVAAELAAFNLKFGLPGCTTKAIATNATLPLAAASTSAGCELAVVYSNANAGMTSAALAYNAGWATEITLDVQWAGLIAVANAQRVLAAKAMLGVPHALLYGGIASVPGSYASAFADITQGSNGSCSTCTAKTGYDPLTGLGTPNAANLLAALTAASSTTTPTTPSVAGAPPTPLKTGPVITAAAMTGVQGQTMTGSIGVSNTDNLAMSVTISGVPTGMRFTLSGSTLTARWASPAIGNYSLSLRALDSAGHSSAATVPVTVSAK